MNGSLTKTAKSKLTELIENDGEPIDTAPPASVWITDLMALLMSLSNLHNTFPEFSSLRDDIFSFQYPNISIKNVEILHRAYVGKLLVKLNSGAQQLTKQWEKFMSCGENKTILVEFLFMECLEPVYENKIAVRFM